MRDYLTLHLGANSSKGTCLFIDVLYFSYSSAFNNEHNSYHEMSAKRPIACSWAIPFTSVDKRYI